LALTLGHNNHKKAFASQCPGTTHAQHDNFKLCRATTTTIKEHNAEANLLE
jgi:hypothetical protein